MLDSRSSIGSLSSVTTPKKPFTLGITPMFQKSLLSHMACATLIVVLTTSDSKAQFSAGVATPNPAPVVQPAIQNGVIAQGVVVPPVTRPVYSPSRVYVPSYPYPVYGYGYSAPYQSRAYPYGTSYLGPTIYPRYTYPRVRVQTTRSRSRTFGGAHSSQYFGNPHASQYFGN